MADNEYDPNQTGEDSEGSDYKEKLRSANKPMKKGRRGRRKKSVKLGPESKVLLEVDYYMGVSPKKIESIGEDEVALWYGFNATQGRFS